jgi:hypothetical protein
MQDQTWQEFSQRMAYEGTMHIAVEPLGGLPDAPALAGYNERNMHVLRTLASLDERRAENSGDDDSPLMQELMHMDSKINVLMEIVNRLLIPVALLPARQTIRFNALGVVVPQAMLPTPASQEAGALLIRLHFDACRALPLELPSQLSMRFDDGTAFVSFFQSSELVEDGLDRFVFRHHRRKVAEGRLTGA